VDTTLPVSYRGLTLTGAAGGPGGNNPIQGFRLTRATFSDVSVHGYTEKRSLDDGFDASDVFIGMRNIVLAGEVYSDRKAGLFDLLDLLRLKFTPTDAYNEDPSEQGFLPLAFQQPTLYTVYWPTGIVDRVIYSRPSAQPQYDIQNSAIGGRPDDGYVVPFSTALIAKDPRFYAPVPVEVSLGGTVGSGTLQNRGSYPAPLQFIVALPGSEAGEATFNFVGANTNMTVTVPASASDRQVNVDSIKKVCTFHVNGVETLRMDLIDFAAGYTWPKVPPVPEGDSPVGYDWTSDLSLDAASKMFYEEAWV